ncbi:MAG: hypothetical protein WCX81_01170 [Monoglobales bacterium]
MKKNPIGFFVKDNEMQVENEIMVHDEKTTEPRKSVAEVYFPARHMTLSYYNDMFNLKVGDLVYVEGKLEGLQGRVVSVNYSFKIKLSDYKKIIAVIDTTMNGDFYFAGSHMVCFDEKTMPYDKVSTWFKPPKTEEFVVGNGENHFLLDDLSTMNVSKDVVDRGFDYYNENRVKYLSIDGTHGRAIVDGSETYELEFEYNDGEISNLTCSCFCSFSCKHQVAAMLQLRETLDIIEKNYGKEFGRYFAALSKDMYIQMTVARYDIGKITLTV